MNELTQEGGPCSGLLDEEVNRKFSILTGEMGEGKSPWKPTSEWGLGVSEVSTRRAKSGYLAKVPRTHETCDLEDFNESRYSFCTVATSLGAKFAAIHASESGMASELRAS